MMLEWQTKLIFSIYVLFPNNLEFIVNLMIGLPWRPGEESACTTGDLGLIPRLGRSPGGGHGNPVQYPCLMNSMDTGAWQATVSHGVVESDTTQRLSLSNNKNKLTKLPNELLNLLRNIKF